MNRIFRIWAENKIDYSVVDLDAVLFVTYKVSGNVARVALHQSAAYEIVFDATIEEADKLVNDWIKYKENR